MFCSKCGAQLPDNAAFCTACGTAVENGQPAVGGGAPQPLPPKKSKKGLIIGIIAGVVVVVAIVVAVLFGTGAIGGKDSGDSEDNKTTSSQQETEDNNDSLYSHPVNVGTKISFGSYEQDNDTSNGKEDVEWLVLAKKGNKILVISEKAIDCQPYNIDPAMGDPEDVTWENCTLRKWLNDDFLNTAFSAEEQAKILTTNVTADKNPSYDTDPGNATKDKVFLLSINEANKYFDSDIEKQCKSTAYARANESSEYEGEFDFWWLRSPGNYQNYAANVGDDGMIYENGIDVNNANNTVRPALWINLEQ